jgi:hypothetical protein
MLVPMNPRSLILFMTGLLLLGLAGAVVFFPLPAACPDLPEIAPFSPQDRLALFLPEPEALPPPEALGLVQRARAAGAEVRFFAPSESIDEFNPTRQLQPAPWPNSPTGYHPDQWPTLPATETGSSNDWHLLILTPEEQAVKNAAIVDAAHALRDSGTDDAPGTREAALLSRARRAELFLPLIP